MVINNKYLIIIYLDYKVLKLILNKRIDKNTRIIY